MVTTFPLMPDADQIIAQGGVRLCRACAGDLSCFDGVLCCGTCGMRESERGPSPRRKGWSRATPNNSASACTTWKPRSRAGRPHQGAGSPPGFGDRAVAGRSCCDRSTAAGSRDAKSAEALSGHPAIRHRCAGTHATGRRPQIRGRHNHAVRRAVLGTDRHDAHQRAAGQVYSCLIERGFNPTQIAAWDRGAEFETQIATGHALADGGSTEAVDDRFLKRYEEYQKELFTVLVTNSGVWQTPADTPGTVSVGPMDCALPSVGSGRTAGQQLLRLEQLTVAAIYRHRN